MWRCMREVAGGRREGGHVMERSEHLGRSAPAYGDRGLSKSAERVADARDLLRHLRSPRIHDLPGLVVSAAENPATSVQVRGI
jgi:hypothetical protein